MDGKHYPGLEADRKFSEMHSKLIASAKVGEVETVLRELEVLRQFAELHGFRFSKYDENTVMWTAYRKRVNLILEECKSLAESGDVLEVESKIDLAKEWIMKGGIDVDEGRLSGILRRACRVGITKERRCLEDIIRKANATRNIDKALPSFKSAIDRARTYASRSDGISVDDIDRIECLFYALACDIRLSEAEQYAKEGNILCAERSLYEAERLGVNLGARTPNSRIHEVKNYVSMSCIFELVRLGRFSVAAEKLSEIKGDVDADFVQQVVDCLDPGPGDIDELVVFLDMSRNLFEDVYFDSVVSRLADDPDRMDDACSLTERFAYQIDSDVHAGVAARRPAEQHVRMGHFYLASRAIEQNVVDASALGRALEACDFYEVEPCMEDVEAFVEAAAPVLGAVSRPFKRLRDYLVDSDETEAVAWLDNNYSDFV